MNLRHIFEMARQILVDKVGCFWAQDNQPTYRPAMRVYRTAAIGPIARPWMNCWT